MAQIPVFTSVGIQFVLQKRNTERSSWKYTFNFPKELLGIELKYIESFL